MRWQRHGSSTLCLAVTLYLSENKNTLSAISAADGAPVRSFSWITVNTHDLNQIKQRWAEAMACCPARIDFAACERSNNNKYRPIIWSGEWTQVVCLRSQRAILRSSHYLLINSLTNVVYTWFKCIFFLIFFFFVPPRQPLVRSLKSTFRDKIVR